MSDKTSGKMASALLAMALSYYYVMGEHIEKEIRRTDEILTTLLNWSSDDTYSNLTVDGRKSNILYWYNKQNALEETFTGFIDFLITDFPFEKFCSVWHSYAWH